jgi:hypothetical protein
MRRVLLVLAALAVRNALSLDVGGVVQYDASDPHLCKRGIVGIEGLFCRELQAPSQFQGPREISSCVSASESDAQSTSECTLISKCNL